MKIHLQKLEKSLIFQILEQSDINRGNGLILNGLIPVSIRKSIPFSFESNSYPQIDILCIDHNKNGQFDDGLEFDHKFKYSSGSFFSLENLESGSILEIKIKLGGVTQKLDNRLIPMNFKNNKVRDQIYNILIKCFKTYNSYKLGEY